MRKLVAILLIPFLLFGQTVGAAHVHPGATPESAAEHAARPHVHLHGHEGHSHALGHSHADFSYEESEDAGDEPRLREAVDHDADALYGAGGSVAKPRKDGSANVRTFPAVVSYLPALVTLTTLQESPSLRRWHPPDDTAKRPLYLRICFLRC